MGTQWLGVFTALYVACWKDACVHMPVWTCGSLMSREGMTKRKTAANFIESNTTIWALSDNVVSLRSLTRFEVERSLLQWTVKGGGKDSMHFIHESPADLQQRFQPADLGSSPLPGQHFRDRKAPGCWFLGSTLASESQRVTSLR